MGDRPSWREIDKRKEQGGGSGRYSSSNDLKRSRNSKASLDKLFSSGKLGQYVKSKEEDLNIKSDSDKSLISLVKKALRISGREKFFKEAEKIIKQHGAPSDFPFLIRCLEISDIDIIRLVLKKIEEMLQDDRVPDRSRAMRVQIKMLPVKFGDPVIDDLSSSVLKLL